jgi:hypothetical protein
MRRPRLQPFLRAGIVGLGTHECPKFIAQQETNAGVANMPVIRNSAGAAHVANQLENSVFGHVRHTND